MRNNELVVGDTVYEITPAYLKGAEDMRSSVPFNRGNSYRADSQNQMDWEAGHSHESAGYHIIDGIDVIKSAPKGRTFTVAAESATAS